METNILAFRRRSLIVKDTVNVPNFFGAMGSPIRVTSKATSPTFQSRTQRRSLPDLSSLNFNSLNLQPPPCNRTIPFSDLQLGRVIGKGAFGKVYQGQWNNRTVAIKMLICQDLQHDLIRDLHSEIKIMSVLQHPNICRLLGACMEPKNYALVLELSQRGSLWGVLRHNRRALTLEMCIKFLYETAKGMSYLHHFKRPILHRDLKSPNLLVDKQYSIKISDFGLARVKAHVQTMTGNCGTVQWMAPEVLGHQQYTEKADVYSFAIVIWEVMTGRCPYDEMSQIHVALGVLNRDLRPGIPRDCPPFFARLMKSCWKREAELRPTFPQLVNLFRTYQSKALRRGEIRIAELDKSAA